MTYDCSENGYDDDDASLEALPCLSGGPNWKQLGQQLGTSLAIWIFVVFVAPVLNWVWHRFVWAQNKYGRKLERAPPFWIQLYVGTAHRKPHRTKVETVLTFLQFMGSSGLLVTWIVKSYSLGRSLTVGALEPFFVTICVLHGLFMATRESFSRSAFCTICFFVDCLTLPAVAMQHQGGYWLTLSFLRTYHMRLSLMKLRDLKIFDEIFSEFEQEVTTALIDTILFASTIAGTVWVLEGLGDIEGLADQFTASGMGAISFFQMLYFSFVT